MTMKTYNVRQITFEEIELDSSRLISFAEAARIMGITYQGVVSAVNRGVLTLVEDPSARYHGRRLVKLDEVMALASEESLSNGDN